MLFSPELCYNYPNHQRTQEMYINVHEIPLTQKNAKNRAGLSRWALRILASSSLVITPSPLVSKTRKAAHMTSRLDKVQQAPGVVLVCHI